MPPKKEPTPPLSPSAVALVAPPPDIDEHNADQARRAAEMEKVRPKLLDCCDPTEAKRYEDRKPLYEWRVQVGIFRPSKGTQPAHMKKFDEEVVAQTESDAWAMFCDKIREWPSRRDRRPVITKLRRRTLNAARDDEGDDE